jgi:hypothetical protein
MRIIPSSLRRLGLRGLRLLFSHLEATLASKGRSFLEDLRRRHAQGCGATRSKV